MKKIISLLALFMGLSAFAQNFPGEKVELLKGKTIKVLPKKESLQEYGYREFYKDAELKKIYKKDGTSTPYEALVGKEFKVVSYQSYTKGITFKRYKLTLENPETGILYYSYNPSNDVDYPFEVIGELDFPEGYFCDKITYHNAKSIEPGDVWYQTPVETGVKLICHIGKKHTLFIDLFTAIDGRQTSEIGNKGAVIIFDNGATISRPNETVRTDARIITTIGVYGDEEELKLLSEHKIVKMKIANDSYDVANGATVREYVKCLLKM